MNFIARMCLLHNPKVWGTTEQDIKEELLENARRMSIRLIKNKPGVVSTGGVSFSFYAIDGDYNKLHVDFLVDHCMFLTGCEDYSQHSITVFESEQERINACLEFLSKIGW